MSANFVKQVSEANSSCGQVLDVRGPRENQNEQVASQLLHGKDRLKFRRCQKAWRAGHLGIWRRSVGKPAARAQKSNRFRLLSFSEP